MDGMRGKGGGVLAGVISGAAVVGVLIAAQALTWGFVGEKLWGWFVVPTTGFRDATLLEAYGLALLAALWTARDERGSADDRDSAQRGRDYVTLSIRPFVILLVAYVVHLIAS